MAILTQNDLNIFAEEYGQLPWDKLGATYDGYIEYLKACTKLPSLYTTAAKNQQKQLSNQKLLVGQAQPVLLYPTKAVKAWKEKMLTPKGGPAPGGPPLLSSYAVRTA